jgi:hypothetical protein
MAGARLYLLVQARECCWFVHLISSVRWCLARTSSDAAATSMAGAGRRYRLSPTNEAAIQVQDQ